MANEITVTASLRCENGYLDIMREVAGAQFAQTTLAYNAGTQTIGFAAAEAITLTDITTPGWAWFRNCDTTNFVTLGDITTGTLTPFAKLQAGEAAVIPLGCAHDHLGAQADTGAVKLEFIVLER
jgi:hypothetical protein